MYKKNIIKLVRNDGQTFTIGSEHDWRLTKNGLENFGTFTNSVTYTDNASTDGGFISTTRLSSADRTIKIAYIKPNMNEIARNKISAFFNAKSKYKIYVTYGGKTRWSECYVKKAVIGTTPDIYKLLSATITFIFANPYWKSLEDFGKNIAAIHPLLGFPYMVSKDNPPVGLAAGVFDFSQKVTVSNDGDTETRCIVSITANKEVINPKIIINDSYVRVIDTMVKNDVIEMDFTALPPTIKKNGKNYVGHCDRSSDFEGMVINIGDTEIQYDADDGSDNMNVNIYYNKLYVSV